MAIFSVGGEDDSEGPSSPRPKKLRTTLTQQEEQQRHQLVKGHQEEEDESDSDSEEDEGESESGEEEEEERDHDRVERAFTNARAPTNSAREDDRRGSAGFGTEASISVTLTDPDVLDCPICFDPLRIPVFQCENGHIACASCCFKLGNRCPSCSLPIGYNRCRAIEKVLEAVKVSCQNLKYGCKETISYSKKHDHEEMCIYAPYSCPIPECNFVGLFEHLYLHFRNKHSISTKCFQYNCLMSLSLQRQEKHLILLEQTEGIIFILNNGTERLGSTVSVSCLGPSMSKRVFSYDLIARNRGSSVRLQSTIESVPRRVELLPPKRFLLVPSDFVTCGQLKLELCIWRHH